MTDYLSSIAQLAKKKNGTNVDYRYIFMKVGEIITMHGGLTFAYGYDIMTLENVAVRLSTIDESAYDILRERKAPNIQEARKTITNQYFGNNARETLERKRDVRHSTYLSFERCFPIEGTNPDYKHFRSHWPKTISAHTDIEFIVGMANITCIDERGTKPQGRIRAAATVIEYIRFLSLESKDNNKAMITHALRNKGKNLLREGCTRIHIMSGDKTIVHILIKQAQSIEKGLNARQEPCEYSVPLSAEESLESFMAPHERVNEFSVMKDINRIVMHVFCNTPLDKSKFSSQDEAYLEQMNQMQSKLASGEYQAKVIGMRVIRFGPRMTEHLLPKGRYDPLLVYKRKTVDAEEKAVFVETYTPTIFAVQISQHNRRFIVFKERISYDIQTNKSCTLEEIDHTINSVPIKLIAFKDEVES